MTIKETLGLDTLAKIEETKIKELCSSEKFKIVGGGCACGGTDSWRERRTKRRS